MNVIDELSTSLGRKDESPNVALAERLSKETDTASIEELVKGLAATEKGIRSDCIKVLYEIGSRNPSLIAPYTAVFLDLLQDNNNRMVWGAMKALKTVSADAAGTIFERLDEVLRAVRDGSVITKDAGVGVLSGIVVAEMDYAEQILPVLLHNLDTCRAKDLPSYAENAVRGFLSAKKAEFIACLRDLLTRRREDLTARQARRVNVVLERLSS